MHVWLQHYALTWSTLLVGTWSAQTLWLMFLMTLKMEKVTSVWNKTLAVKPEMKRSSEFWTPALNMLTAIYFIKMHGSVLALSIHWLETATFPGNPGTGNREENDLENQKCELDQWEMCIMSTTSLDLQCTNWSENWGFEIVLTPIHRALTHYLLSLFVWIKYSFRL